jgi:hypothetical protein
MRAWVALLLVLGSGCGGAGGDDARNNPPPPPPATVRFVPAFGGEAFASPVKLV